MSGFEVVGLVLAVLPVFIEGTKRVRPFYNGVFKKERVLDQFKQGLETQQTLLNLYLKGVLGATKLSPSVQNELMNDLAGEKWQEKHVKSEIEARLGEASRPFLRVLDRIVLVLLDSLKKDETLRLEPGNEAAILDRIRTSKREDIKDRLKFSWKEPSRNKALLEIADCNNELRNLKGAAEGAEQYQKRQNFRRVHAGFQMREEARKLYHVLSSTCNCNTRVPHEANLRMKFCDESFDTNPHSSFDILLLGEHLQSCEVSIRVAHESSFSKVSIKLPDDELDDPDWKALDDVCKQIDTAVTSQERLEWAIDKKERIRLVRKTSSTPAPKTQLLTLETCLQKFARYSNKKRFLRERYILAVVLAHSLLQLHQTPWLASRWSAQDISFLSKPDQLDPNSPLFGYMFRTPYIGSTLWPDQPDPSTPIYALNQRPLLLRLAVLLLEIHMNRSLQPDLASAGDMRGPLLDWLQECYEDTSMNEEYRDAIAWCISPKPDPRTKVISFEEPGFRELYLAEVMSRLEDALEQDFDLDSSFFKTL